MFKKINENCFCYGWNYVLICTIFSFVAVAEQSVENKHSAEGGEVGPKPEMSLYPFHQCISDVCGAPDKNKTLDEMREALVQTPLDPKVEMKISQSFDRGIARKKKALLHQKNILLMAQNAYAAQKALPYNRKFNNYVIFQKVMSAPGIFAAKPSPTGGYSLNRDVLRETLPQFSEQDLLKARTMVSNFLLKTEIFGDVWELNKYFPYGIFYKQLYPNLDADNAFVERMKKFKKAYREFYNEDKAGAAGFKLLAELAESPDPLKFKDSWQALEAEYVPMALFSCLLKDSCEALGLLEPLPQLDFAASGNFKVILEKVNRHLEEFENPQKLQFYKDWVMMTARSKLAVVGSDLSDKKVKGIVERAKEDTHKYLAKNLLSEESRKNLVWDNFEIELPPHAEAERKIFFNALERFENDDELDYISALEKDGVADPRMILALTDSLGDSFQDSISDFVQDNYASLSTSYFDTEVHSFSGPNRIRIGNFEMLDPVFGASACKHEIGHVISYALQKGPLSQETARTYEKIRMCLSVNHNNLKEAGSPREVNRLGLKNTFWESKFAEEDFGDAILAKTARAEEKNYMCRYVTKTNGFYADKELIQTNAAEVHSTFLYLLLHIEATRNGKLNNSCQQAIKRSGLPVNFKDCFDSNNWE